MLSFMLTKSPSRFTRSSPHSLARSSAVASPEEVKATIEKFATDTSAYYGLWISMSFWGAGTYSQPLTLRTRFMTIADHIALRDGHRYPHCVGHALPLRPDAHRDAQRSEGVAPPTAVDTANQEKIAFRGAARQRESAERGS